MIGTSSIRCVQTGLQCQRISCLQIGQCVIGNPVESVTVKVGWKCPVCGKGNAPFMPTCGNQLCGVDLSKATA